MEFLCCNVVTFVWKLSDMLEIPCEITEHFLNTKADAKTV